MTLINRFPATYPVMARALAGISDQRRMALVQPVEIAHCQHRAAPMRRSGTGMSNNAKHGGDLQRGCEIAAKIAADADER